MSLNDTNQPTPEANPVFEKTELSTNEQKLKNSLSHRSKDEKAADELGTAEHRPRRGMVYDAPLGLKF